MSSDYILFLQRLSGVEINGTFVAVNRTCDNAEEHYTFFQFVMIPACLILILFSFLETRRSFLTSFLRGRPGCVFPMDCLSRNSRISYACAFGVTSILLYRILFEQRYAFKYDGPVYLKALVAIVSVVIYGIAYYPVFACLTLGSVFGYAVGALYVWMFTGMEFYTIFKCPVSVDIRMLWLARNFPPLLCWLYLSVSIPARFILTIKRRRAVESAEYEFEIDQTLADIRNSYQGVAVKKLLNRPPPKQPPPVGTGNKIKSAVKTIVHGWLYHWQKGFTYSSRVLSVMFVCFVIQYTITYELITGLYPLFTVILRGLTWNIDNVYGLHPVPGEDPLISTGRVSALLTYYIFYSVNICVMVSTSVSFLLGILTLLQTLASYRRNLQALYRGDHSHIPPKEERSNASLMVGFLRYAGYQVGYVAWAYVIHFVILLLLTVGLTVVISFIRVGQSAWLVSFITNYWPVPTIAFLLNILQLLVSKFCFLQERGDVFAIENRRALYVFTFFMFFFNIFLGIASCLMRILKSIAVGAVLLGRLDHSTLTRGFQFLDPGFAAYVGFMHVENYHTHPVLMVFVRLMMLNLTRESGKNSGEYIQMWEDPLSDKEETARRQKKAARFNWHVAYTLLNNPSVRMYRKGYIQALNRALKEGRRLQVSDKLVDELRTLETTKENGDVMSVEESSVRL